MNELSIIKTIENIIGNEHIGDDCAYIRDLGIVVSQDSLIEDIHFKRKWCTPYQLGYKSAIVNISDIIVSGAIPKYLTVSLSLPDNLSDDFINEFYKGIKSANNNIDIIGGDITGSPDKIFISITAIGITKNRNISSRKNAKKGYVVVTKGNFGSSAAGLQELINNGNNYELIKSHLEPELEYDFTEYISTVVKEPYAMMDTSDGLADALFKIAEASGVKIIADYNKIPHLNNINDNFFLFGGEDYKPVAVIPEKYINDKKFTVIGRVVDYDGIRLDISGNVYRDYSELKVFNHFGDNNG